MKKVKYILIGFTAYFVLLYALIASEKSVEGSSINNFYDAIWYSIVTLSTVGYGDFYPVSFTKIHLK